jgi:hypothetical protein
VQGEGTRRVWSGIIGYSRDKLPFVGSVPGSEGLYAAVAFHGHGECLLDGDVLTPQGCLASSAAPERSRHRSRTLSISGMSVFHGPSRSVWNGPRERWKLRRSNLLDKDCRPQKLTSSQVVGAFVHVSMTRSMSNMSEPVSITRGLVSNWWPPMINPAQPPDGTW